MSYRRERRGAAALAALERGPVSGVFESDRLASHEYWEGRKLQRSGAQRLMLAVLEDAVGCYKRYCTAPEQSRDGLRFMEVEEWFRVTDHTWPFSFASICDVLGLDRGYTRDRLENWRRQRIADGQKPLRIGRVRPNVRRHQAVGLRR